MHTGTVSGSKNPLSWKYLVEERTLRSSIIFLFIFFPQHLLVDSFRNRTLNFILTWYALS